VAAKKFRLEKTPFGTPALVTNDDPQGRGAETRGNMITIPDEKSDPASLPHELMHAGVSTASNLIPGGVVVELLLKKLSEYGYGDRAIYQDPGERIAYGYQEAATGQPDVGFQDSLSPESVASYPSGKSNMLVRNLLDILGSGTEKFGRWKGKQQVK